MQFNNNTPTNRIIKSSGENSECRIERRRRKACSRGVVIGAESFATAFSTGRKLQAKHPAHATHEN
jgi:hypothetical protein